MTLSVALGPPPDRLGAAPAPSTPIVPFRSHVRISRAEKELGKGMKSQSGAIESHARAGLGEPTSWRGRPFSLFIAGGAPEVPPRCLRGSSEVPPRCGRGAAEVLPRCCRDAAEVLPRCCRGAGSRHLVEGVLAEPVEARRAAQLTHARGRVELRPHLAARHLLAQKVEQRVLCRLLPPTPLRRPTASPTLVARPRGGGPPAPEGAVLARARRPLLHLPVRRRLRDASRTCRGRVAACSLLATAAARSRRLRVAGDVCDRGAEHLRRGGGGSATAPSRRARPAGGRLSHRS